MDAPVTPQPTLGHALGVIADTALDQARDLAVAQLDRWTSRLHERLSTTPTQSAPPPPSTIPPLIVGALTGAAVAWLVTARQRES